MVVVIDYGVGNIGSVMNMLKKIGVEAKGSIDFRDIETADHLILPGVGHFDNGMSRLKGSGVIDILHERVIGQGIPILGICLGMQLLCQGSDEGRSTGLGWVDAKIERFKFPDERKDLKIPHMGWNTISPTSGHALFTGLDESRFYFVHSFHAVCNDENVVLAKTRHGYDFAAAIGKKNVMGVQFHPEKSHKFGMALLENFINFC